MTKLHVVQQKKKKIPMDSQKMGNARKNLKTSPMDHEALEYYKDVLK